MSVEVLRLAPPLLSQVGVIPRQEDRIQSEENKMNGLPWKNMRECLLAGPWMAAPENETKFWNLSLLSPYGRSS